LVTDLIEKHEIEKGWSGKMKVPVFTGSSTAIVTPFRDGKVDYKKLGELIDFQIAGGTTAITICGTTGESSTQSLEEHTATVDFCVKHVNSRVKVIAGTGSNDTQAALFLSQEAEKSGVDALLMVTPYYNKTTQRGLVKHFSFIADRVNVPIILYNVPARTGMSFTSETYRELSKHTNINGVKEASGNFSLIASTLAACGDTFFFWSGNDEDVVPMMSIGAKGVISVLANVVPAAVAEMTKAGLDGDFKRAAELQLKYLDLIDKLFIEVNPMPVKAALNLMGMNVGEPRMPLCDLAPENLEKLNAALDKVGLLP
jgi:4-hydroxy-tetrahydrodipicolinate synthase